MLRRTTRNPIIGGLIVAGALTLSACSSGGGSSAQNAEQSDSPSNGGHSGVTSLQIAVTHYPTNMDSVPYIAAMNQGYFEDAGIKIKSISGSEGGGTTARTVLSGDMSFGEVSTAAVVQAARAGADLHIASGGVQSLATSLVIVRKDSSLRGIKDLAGKKVSYTHDGSVTQGALALSLDAAGIDESAVKTVALGSQGNEFTVLKKGGVDAAVVASPAYLTEADSFRILYRISDYVPGFTSDVIVPNNGIEKSDPELVRSFLRARARGVTWVKNHVKAAAQMWAEKAHTDPKTSYTLLNKILKVAPDYYATGLTTNGLLTAQKEMRLVGLLPDDASVPWDKLLMQEFLPKGAPKADLNKLKAK